MKKGKGKKKSISTWSKDVVCLKDHNQEASPTTEQKIQLAQLNLGMKKLVFNVDSDATEVHEKIISAFPVLSECGGYSLMRVADNSRDLIAIDGCEGGANVSYLKDILRQAKLYVRPLQCDISEDRQRALNKESKEVWLFVYIDKNLY